MEFYQSGRTEDIQRRTTGIRNLDFTVYKDRARFPSIPLPEQKKIAHILSTVQRAIEAQKRIIQTTTDLKKALMHKLFTEGLLHEPQKQTKIGPVPESWEVCTVLDALQRTRVGRQHQIPAKEIAGTGVHPVVDQGQSFVSGFTDQSDRLIDFDLPLVIFGDHTRCFKFVDFPFVLGADGTKVLKPNPKLFDPKFFFYALDDLVLPSRGYNRHFKLLKEKSIPKPQIAEQREIAEAINAAEKKTTLHRRKRDQFQDLFRTLLHELMTAKTRVHNAAFEV
jgi:type I restriction enzyme S subunit